VNVCTLGFEILNSQSQSRNLGDGSQVASLSIGVLLTIIFNAILILMVVVATIKLSIIDEKHSLYSIVVGLKNKSRTEFVLYYAHYIGFWYLIVILISLSYVIPSVYLWGILSIAQLAAAFEGITKCFTSAVTWLINFLTECYIALVFLFCFSLHFMDLNSDTERD